jgi:hypothetical protein
MWWCPQILSIATMNAAVVTKKASATATNTKSYINFLGPEWQSAS